MKRLLYVLLSLPLWLTACSAQTADLQRPNGVAVAADGSLYVMDFGHYRIVHLSSDGRFIGAFGKFGTRAEQLYYGWDLALDPQDNLYFGNMVRDDEGVRSDGLKVFTPNGQFLREVGAKTYPRGSTEWPNKPYGLDVDSQGRIFVADYGTCILRIFDSEGNLLAQFFDGSEGQFIFTGLNDVTVDDQRGLLYAVDFDASLIQQFKLDTIDGGIPTLVHQATIGAYGRQAGQLAFPQYITVDEDSGNLYVGDLANRRIQVFDLHGDYLNHFTAPGVVDWQVMGLAIGNNHLYVADSLNNAVWAFTLDGQLQQRIGAAP